MKSFAVIVLALAFVALARGQRAPYAGVRPIGYPEVASRFQTEDEQINAVIQNRFQNAVDSTPEPLPVDARGDGNLVNRISKWPVQQQPFWYLNAQQIEAYRNKTPVVLQQPSLTSRFQG